MKKVIFATGGTGGHIYPALSIAEKLREKNVEVLFIGTKHRMEKDIIPRENFKFIGLDVLPIKSITSIYKIIVSIFKAIGVLRREKPTEIIGFGNYITIPVLTAAILLRIPYYLQEQNSTMGQANKYFYKWARKVFIAFENTKESIPEKYREKFVVTGNPLRKDFYIKNKEKERELLGISPLEKVILVIGGSLGAKSINDAIAQKWKSIVEDKEIKMFWGTGKNNFEETTSRIHNFGNSVVKPYFDNVADIMSAADLVICRAGASTISELIQLEKPSILIPYDFVGQKENADALEYIDASRIFTNEQAEKAIEEALILAKQEEILKFMQDNLKKLKKGNAADLIIKEMEL